MVRCFAGSAEEAKPESFMAAIGASRYGWLVYDGKTDEKPDGPWMNGKVFMLSLAWFWLIFFLQESPYFFSRENHGKSCRKYP